MRAGKIRLNLVADAVRCSIFNRKTRGDGMWRWLTVLFFFVKIDSIVDLFDIGTTKEVNTFQTSATAVMMQMTEKRARIIVIVIIRNGLDS